MSLSVWSLTADILRAPETEIEMTWQYQVRFDLKDAATAESARRDLRHPLLAPLADILANHRAALKCQFDAFAEYVATAEEYVWKIIRFMSGRRQQSKIPRRRRNI